MRLVDSANGESGFNAFQQRRPRRSRGATTRLSRRRHECRLKCLAHILAVVAETRNEGRWLHQRLGFTGAVGKAASPDGCLDVHVAFAEVSSREWMAAEKQELENQN